MTDHHDAQDYTANGPSDAGFRTGGDGTGITNGVVASGTSVGVIGKGLGIEGSTAASVGVRGQGDTGVVGSGSTGVYGAGGVKGVEGHGGVGVSGSGERVGVEGTSDTIGVKGSAREVGVGVSGESARGTGVSGHSIQGPGLRGSSRTNYGGVFASNFAQLRLEPADTLLGPPRTGHHAKGELFVDAAGSLFYCYSGSPPGWEKLAGRSSLRDSLSAVIRAIRRVV